MTSNDYGNINMTWTYTMTTDTSWYTLPTYYAPYSQGMTVSMDMQEDLLEAVGEGRQDSCIIKGEFLLKKLNSIVKHPNKYTKGKKKRVLLKREAVLFRNGFEEYLVEEHTIQLDRE